MNRLKRAFFALFMHTEHDWFPNHPPREFIITTDVCMDCDEIRVNLPWGECLGGHPMAEHYSAKGERLEVPHCLTNGPQ